ncbi:MAG: hypothetical protein RL701_424 [Pseudomonadota bacterium]
MRLFLAIGCCLSLVASSSLASLAHADGRLGRAKEAASGSDDDDSDRSSSGGSGRHHGHHSDDDDDDDDDTGVGAAFGELLARIIAAAIRGDGSPPAAYAPYPYASTLAPYLVPDSELQVAALQRDDGELDADMAAHSTRMQAWAGQVALAGGYFSGVGQSQLAVRVLTPSRWEINARGAWLYEPAARENAFLADAGAGLRLVQTGGFMLRLLGAVNAFGDGQRAAFGGSAGLGFDLFLGAPVVLSATASAGAVGSAGLLDARAQLGVMVSRVELFAAFQYLIIGPSNLSAPLLGARLWL